MHSLLSRGVLLVVVVVMSFVIEKIDSGHLKSIVLASTAFLICLESLWVTPVLDCDDAAVQLELSLLPLVIGFCMVPLMSIYFLHVAIVSLLVCIGYSASVAVRFDLSTMQYVSNICLFFVGQVVIVLGRLQIEHLLIEKVHHSEINALESPDPSMESDVESQATATSVAGRRNFVRQRSLVLQSGLELIVQQLESLKLQMPKKSRGMVDAIKVSLTTMPNLMLPEEIVAPGKLDNAKIDNETKRWLGMIVLRKPDSKTLPSGRSTSGEAAPVSGPPDDPFLHSDNLLSPNVVSTVEGKTQGGGDGEWAVAGEAEGSHNSPSSSTGLWRHRGAVKFRSFSGTVANEVVGLTGVPKEDELLQILRESFGDWGFDMLLLDELSQGRSVHLIAGHMIDTHQLDAVLRCEKRTLSCFVTEIAAAYLDANPYHNKIHAAAVMYDMYYFMTVGGLSKNANLSDLQFCVAVLAALTHDVAHNGRSNSFHVKTGSELAITYSDSSVCERHHLATTFSIMHMPGCDVFHGLDEEERRESRAAMIDMILATDLALHFEHVARLRAIVLAGATSGQAGGGLKACYSDSKLLLRMAIKISDLGHTAKPGLIHSKWTRLISEEMYRQGDEERALKMEVSAFMDRYRRDTAASQASFFKFLVLPLFDVATMLIERSGTISLQLEENLRYWRTRRDHKMERASTVSGVEAHIDQWHPPDAKLEDALLLAGGEGQNDEHSDDSLRLDGHNPANKYWHADQAKAVATGTAGAVAASPTPEKVMLVRRGSAFSLFADDDTADGGASNRNAEEDAEAAEDAAVEAAAAAVKRLGTNHASNRPRRHSMTGRRPSLSVAPRKGETIMRASLKVGAVPVVSLSGTHTTQFSISDPHIRGALRR